MTRCESCGQEIPAERAWLHERGLDGARPECPRQDLVEIAMRARPLWQGNEWTAMRARFQVGKKTPVTRDRVAAGGARAGLGRPGAARDPGGDTSWASVRG